VHENNIENSKQIKKQDCFFKFMISPNKYKIIFFRPGRLSMFLKICHMRAHCIIYFLSFGLSAGLLFLLAILNELFYIIVSTMHFCCNAGSEQLFALFSL